jgi:hypothetical protein
LEGDEEVELDFFWARAGEARTATAARVEKMLEARMFIESFRVAWV